jgi:hypothetical protein
MIALLQRLAPGRRRRVRAPALRQAAFPPRSPAQSGMRRHEVRDCGLDRAALLGRHAMRGGAPRAAGRDTRARGRTAIRAPLRPAAGAGRNPPRWADPAVSQRAERPAADHRLEIAHGNRRRPCPRPASASRRAARARRGRAGQQKRPVFRPEAHEVVGDDIGGKIRGPASKPRDPVGMKQVVGIHDRDPVAARRVEAEVAGRAGARLPRCAGSRMRASRACQFGGDGGGPVGGGVVAEQKLEIAMVWPAPRRWRRRGKARRCGRP